MRQCAPCSVTAAELLAHSLGAEKPSRVHVLLTSARHEVLAGLICPAPFAPGRFGLRSTIGRWAPPANMSKMGEAAQPCQTASLSSLAARNATFLLALISIG